MAKYDLLPEFKKYRGLFVPMNPVVLKFANALMPAVQPGKRLDRRLSKEKIDFVDFSAQLICPKEQKTDTLLVYFHGGAFAIKAASYHKNLAQTYALDGKCAVLFVDYRLAPKYKFPVPLKDSFKAYCWALKRPEFSKIIVGGDSAGANLALSVTRLAQEKGLPLPAAQMLVYPAADSRMKTDSMFRYTDTPLWNSRLNPKAWDLYTTPKTRHNALASPLEAKSFKGFPPAYIETAQFDCLHDEGILLAERLKKENIPVVLNETKNTMHGYDIEENSPYVKEQVKKRTAFLRGFSK